MIPLEWMLFCIAATSGAAPLSSERIEVHDLQIALPEWSSLDPTLLVAWAPAPGIRKCFSKAELKRWALNHSAPLPRVSAPVCFEWPLMSLSRTDVETALSNALNTPRETMIVSAWDQRPVAVGPIRFTREQCWNATPQGTEASLTCRGWVEYAPRRRQSVWAKVALKASRPRVTAASVLARGTVLSRENVRVEEGATPPERDRSTAVLDSLIGRRCRRNIPAGREVQERDLDRQLLADRGEYVTLEVRSGGTRLRLPAQAESSGAHGDVIPVRNLESGQVIRARLEERGKAVLILSPGVDR